MFITTKTMHNEICGRLSRILSELRGEERIFFLTISGPSATPGAVRGKSDQAADCNRDQDPSARLYAPIGLENLSAAP